jgi:hypothetical protein
VTRFVDRGAVFAGWVGLAMAAVIAVSFLLVIPIEPVIWFMSPFAGILIGYYANSRSDRRAGPWSRILANAAWAGLVTALSLVLLVGATKALFFFADSGYRDASLGGPVTCASGPDCVYARYLAEPNGPASLEAQGVTDTASFTRYYWTQQASTLGTLFLVTFLGGIGGGLLYGVLRPKSPATRPADGPAAAPSSSVVPPGA